MKKSLSLLLATVLIGSSLLTFTTNATSDSDDVSQEVASEVLGTATYCKKEYAPVMDGEIDEIWNYAEELSGINYDYDKSTHSDTGYAKVLWNESDLFLLAVVTTEDGKEYDADDISNGVIFRVSETNSSELTYRTLSGDWEYGINPMGTAFNVLSKDLPMKAECSAKYNEKEHNYIVELHVPIQTYRLDLEEDDTIAFNFFITNDKDQCSAWQEGTEGPNSLSPLTLIKKDINLDIAEGDSNKNTLDILQTCLLIGGIVIVIGGAIAVILIKKQKH